MKGTNPCASNNATNGNNIAALFLVPFPSVKELALLYCVRNCARERKAYCDLKMYTLQTAYKKGKRQTALTPHQKGTNGSENKLSFLKDSRLSSYVQRAHRTGVKQ